MKEIKNLVGIIFLSIMILSCQSEYEENEMVERDYQIEKRQNKIEEYIQDDPCVTYFIRSNCAGSLLGLVNNSINAYNNIGGTNLEFALVSNEDDADVVIECISLGTNCLGGIATLGLDSSDPNIEDDQTIVQINTNGQNCCDQDDPEPLTSCQQQVIIMHEIGHSIGLAHTDESGSYTVGGVIIGYEPDGSPIYSSPPKTYFIKQIVGTPSSDDLSLFNSGDGIDEAFCGSNCTTSFSSNDLKAIRLLYPGCYCECEFGNPDFYYEYWKEYLGDCDDPCSIPYPICKKIGSPPDC